MYARKQGERGIQNHMRDVGPYTRVGRVAACDNCTPSFLAYVEKIGDRDWGRGYVQLKADTPLNDHATTKLINYACMHDNVLANLKYLMTFCVHS